MLGRTPAGPFKKKKKEIWPSIAVHSNRYVHIKKKTKKNMFPYSSVQSKEVNFVRDRFFLS